LVVSEDSQPREWGAVRLLIVAALIVGCELGLTTKGLDSVLQ
jgi:hypothetical protein